MGKAKIVRAEEVPAKTEPLEAESHPEQETKQDANLQAVQDDSQQEDDGSSLYPPGTRLFKYVPEGGGEPILFPMDFERPDKVWLWELNDLPFLSQSFAWMKRANVAKVMQRRAVELPDSEYPQLFSKWFQAMGGGATPGE